MRACRLLFFLTASGMNAQATSDNAALSDVPNEAAAALLRVGRGIKSSFNSGCCARAEDPGAERKGLEPEHADSKPVVLRLKHVFLAAPAGAEDPQGLEPEEADSKVFNAAAFVLMGDTSRELPSSH